jgi:E3 SUMO-protein ligase PIAS1
MEKMAHDKSLRVMVFCTSDQQTNPRDVSFPYLSEVRVNGGVIMANLRGLKGKAGSTRPVDITEMLRMNPVKYANKVELIYAATDKERTPIFLSQLS